MTKDNGCVGSYSVSGYTRGDGTDVSGYTRSCGAAHNSSNSSTSSKSSSNPQLDDEEKMKQRAELLYPQTENKQNKNVKHQIKNVIAVDYIENPAAKWLGEKATGKEAAENLKQSKIIYNKAQAKSILAAVGIEDEDIINDLTTSDEAKTIEAATRIANRFKNMQEETAKKTKEQLANIDITPAGSNKPTADNVMTWEKFSMLSAEEQDKFANEHPEEFENL